MITRGMSIRVGVFGISLLLAACSGGSGSKAGSPASHDGGSDGTALPDGGGPGNPDGSPEAAPEASPAYSGGAITVGVAGDPATVTGTVTIHVDATTPTAISKIDVLVDSQSVGTLTSTPFDLSWDSSTVSNGAHTLSATAYDLAGKTGTAPPVQITTQNFLLAGTWTWSNITYATTGFPTDNCSSTSFTVTFDQATSTVTFPTIDVTCTAGNGAPYTSTATGFTTTVAAADYGGPLNYTSGYTTTNFSTTTLTQTQTPFAGTVYTLSGDVARQ